MNNKVFGEVTFNSGWETAIEVTFNKDNYRVVVVADAYFEKDSITEQQEKSFMEFKEKVVDILSAVENMINNFKYKPVLLLFKRNGEYGLIFDDIDDVEGGIVVTIKPKMEILSVDQYL